MSNRYYSKEILLHAVKLLNLHNQMWFLGIQFYCSGFNWFGRWGGGGDRYHLGGRIGSSLRVRGGGCDVEVGLGVGGGVPWW